MCIIHTYIYIHSMVYDSAAEAGESGSGSEDVELTPDSNRTNTTTE